MCRAPPSCLPGPSRWPSHSCTCLPQPCRHLSSSCRLQLGKLGLGIPAGPGPLASATVPAAKVESAAKDHVTQPVTHATAMPQVQPGSHLHHRRCVQLGSQLNQRLRLPLVGRLAHCRCCPGQREVHRCIGQPEEEQYVLQLVPSKGLLHCRPPAAGGGGSERLAQHIALRQAGSKAGTGSLTALSPVCMPAATTWRIHLNLSEGHQLPGGQAAHAQHCCCSAEVTASVQQKQQPQTPTRTRTGRGTVLWQGKAEPAAWQLAG